MKDFFGICPKAEIDVIDNASQDRTQELARAAYSHGHRIMSKRLIRNGRGL